MDDLVASAVSHWGPRFTATASPSPTSSGSPPASSAGPTGAPRGRRPAPSTSSSGRRRSPRAAPDRRGEHLAQAAVYHHFAKFVFVEDLDQMRAAHGRAVACLTTRCRTSTRPAAGSRSRSRAAGWSASCGCRARRRPAPASCCSCPASTPPRRSSAPPRPRSSTAAWPRSASTDPARARRSTTCRSAATGRRSPRRSGTRSAALPEVDRDRLGVWGVSLGGYYAPRVAAALGDRVARLRRPGRPVQLRRLLGRACRS